MFYNLYTGLTSYLLTCDSKLQVIMAAVVYMAAEMPARPASSKVNYINHTVPPHQKKIDLFSGTPLLRGAQQC